MSQNTLPGSEPPAAARSSAATSSPVQPKDGWRQWLGVYALALGCFSFVSTEISPIGLLPEIATGEKVSLGTAGLLVSGFAIVVAISAGPLTAASTAWSRRFLMSLLLCMSIAGDLLASVADQYWVLLLARVIVALAIGVFWSTAAATAVRLVPEKHAVRATTIVIGGLSLAVVAGVPLATWLGQHAGFHAAFAALAVVSLVALVIAGTFLPPLRSDQPSRLADLPAAMRWAPIRVAVAVTALVMTGTFLLFTYITPYLEHVTGIRAGAIAILLVVVGGAGVVGTFGIAPLIRRNFERSLLGAIALLAVSLIALWVFGHIDWLTIALLVPWGAAYGAQPVLLQTWVFRETAASGTRPEAASSLYVSAYNAAIAIGAFVGSLIVDSAGARLVALLGGLLALAALIITLAHVHHRHGHAE
jgi:predicted MFS family arabinose efflux permease